MTATDWSDRIVEVQQDFDRAMSHPKRDSRDVEALQGYVSWLKAKKMWAEANVGGRSEVVYKQPAGRIGR